MNGKTFDDTQYQFAHGCKPRGRGTWAFATRAAVRAANSTGEMPEGIVWGPGNATLTEAKATVPAGDWIVLS